MMATANDGGNDYDDGDGNGAMGSGSMGYDDDDDGNNNDEGDGNGAMGSGATGYDDDDDGNR